MSAAIARTACGTATRREERGAVLAVGLLLLLVLTILGVSGLVGAALELRMAANAQYQERAFQAAEFGIEQAINSPDLSTSFTYSEPKVVPSSGGRLAVPGSSPDAYSYRLYYDAATGGTPVPGGSPVAGIEARHFVIEATGSSARGATDTHVQGFYILVPADSPETGAGEACPVGSADCGGLTDFAPRRTYWLQKNAE